jgi:hypothetical protein
VQIPVPQQQQQQQFPPPSLPRPLLTTPPPPQAPSVPGDRWRAVAVGLLNLTGLGLGYVLMRRWRAAVL